MHAGMIDFLVVHLTVWWYAYKTNICVSLTERINVFPQQNYITLSNIYTINALIIFSNKYLFRTKLFCCNFSIMAYDVYHLIYILVGIFLQLRQFQYHAPYY